jgi:hypothetical protein
MINSTRYGVVTLDSRTGAMTGVYDCPDAHTRRHLMEFEFMGEHILALFEYSEGDGTPEMSRAVEREIRANCAFDHITI